MFWGTMEVIAPLSLSLCQNLYKTPCWYHLQCMTWTCDKGALLTFGPTVSTEMGFSLDTTFLARWPFPSTSMHQFFADWSYTNTLHQLYNRQVHDSLRSPLFLPLLPAPPSLSLSPPPPPPSLFIFNNRQRDNFDTTRTQHNAILASLSWTQHNAIISSLSPVQRPHPPGVVGVSDFRACSLPGFVWLSTCHNEKLDCCLHTHCKQEKPAPSVWAACCIPYFYVFLPSVLPCCPRGALFPLGFVSVSTAVSRLCSWSPTSGFLSLNCANSRSEYVVAKQSLQRRTSILPDSAACHWNA